MSRIHSAAARVFQRFFLATSLVASALYAVGVARADVTPFVDHYKTNLAANATESTNAVLALLSGFDRLWTPGTVWNTGSPTVLGAPILSQNIHYVVNATRTRTPPQTQLAYLIDRRNQAYSAINGLGNLADIYKTRSGAFTTISDLVPADATKVVYTDSGN